MLLLVPLGLFEELLASVVEFVAFSVEDTVVFFGNELFPWVIVAGVTRRDSFGGTSSNPAVNAASAANRIQRMRCSESYTACDEELLHVQVAVISRRCLIRLDSRDSLAQAVFFDSEDAEQDN